MSSIYHYISLCIVCNTCSFLLTYMYIYIYVCIHTMQSHYMYIISHMIHMMLSLDPKKNTTKVHSAAGRPGLGAYLGSW